MSKLSLSALKYRHKDYRQEIQRYILLLIIPLFFCIVLYLSVQQVLTRQIRRNAEETVGQVSAYTSAMMHEVDLVSGAIFSDMAAMNHDDGDHPLPYNLENPASICRQLEIRKWQSHYIKHIFLASEEWQKIYSDGGYYQYNSLGSLLTQVGLSPEDFETIQEEIWNMQTSSHLTDPCYISPYRGSNGNIIGHILVTLDLTVFMDTISNVTADFVCLYNQDSLITSSLLSTDASNVDWNDENAVSRALGRKVKCFYTQVGGYTCMTAIGWHDYYFPFRVISLCFIVYAVVVFLLGFIYLSRVSRARYQQLSDLISALPQDSGETVSYPELLPRVQKALLSLRDKEAAGQALENERVLRNILYQQYNPGSLEKRLQRVGIPNGDTACYVAVFYVRSLNTVALISSDTGDAQDMVDVIFRSSLEQFAGDSLRFVTCSDPGRFTTVFFEPSDDSFSHNVSATCASVCKFMGDSYGIVMQVAVSSQVSAKNLDQGFRQAQSLEKFAVAIDSDSHIFSQDILDRSGELLLSGNFIRQEQILLNTVLMGKYDLIPAMVESILQEHVTPVASDYDMAMGRLRAVANILSEALLSSSPEGIDPAASAKKLQSADSIAALNEAVTAVYGSLAQSMTSGIRTYKEVEQARAYIRDNLSDQNLNVTMICEAVGVIVQRLTPMFREQLDMGIAEYVNYCRIEQAKKLLSGTKLTVKKVGEEVGYSTTDTFTRNFRKMENMTPTEYRRIVS